MSDTSISEKLQSKISKLKVFVDFDGTISVKDIGDELFKDNGEFEPYHSQLVSGKIDIKQYWHIMFANLDPDADEEFLRNYSLKFDIDPYFKKFADLCKKNDLPIKILSDGYDIYIEPILKREGLDWIEFSSNRISFNESENPSPIFPLASESCNCLCASCKRNAMLNELEDDSIAVFIGDGHSDLCVAEHSDIIFAKNKLAAFCNEKKLPHYPYSNFFDVYRIMDSIILKGKMKQRNQAKQLRISAYETE